MTFQPKLVALDIDGTLVDATGMLPNEVRAAVRRVVDAGVPVVLSTGRAWAGAQLLCDALDLPPGPSVCANGAVIVEYPPARITHEVRFDPRATIEKVVEMAPHAAIAVTDSMRWRVSKPFPDGELNGDTVVESVEELCSRPVSRVVVRDPGAADEEFNAMVASLGVHEVSYFIGWSAWADFVPEGVDKAQGLNRVCAQLGIDPAEVLAIGDGRNDIEMLRWAGRGVAVGDAPEEVKAAADHVTASFADGGTIDELDRWFQLAPGPAETTGLPDTYAAAAG